jgi:hypothetical protein
MDMWNEQKLFDYLVNCCYSDLVKARKQMSRWDCYSPLTLHRIELKCRSKHFDGLLIEKKKFDALTEKCKDNLDIPIYINSTPSGVFRFNLYNVEPNWQVGYFGKTTQFSNNNKIPKEIAYLNVNDAEIL